MEEWCYGQHTNMKTQVNRLGECVQMLEQKQGEISNHYKIMG